jgi:hypothetical protein
MSHQVFEELNDQRLASGLEPFANPRNAAGGSLRQLDANVTKERKLEHFSYTLVNPENYDINSQSEVMEFLKELLGDDLFKQVEAKINEHNGNEANKENQIKIGNLGSGEYVGKGKYDSELEKVNTLLSTKTTELEEANKLIADFKKNTKGNEDLQDKITGYETQVETLQKELQETKIKSALKVALLSEKALDIDYLTFKVNEKFAEQGKALELDENDNIKGWDDVLSGLKTQFPTQFETAKGGLKVDPLSLPKGDDRETAPQSLADAIQASYETK